MAGDTDAIVAVLLAIDGHREVRRHFHGRMAGRATKCRAASVLQVAMMPPTVAE